MGASTAVLVPVAALQGESLSEAVVDLLSSVEVVLLGYHEVPDQTALEQARDQYGERLRRTLSAYASLFEPNAERVATRTVFTHDVQDTIERIAIEEATTAILLPNPAPVIKRVLVPIRGPVNLDQLTTTTAEVVDGTDSEVLLFHAAKSEADRETGEELLSTAADQLETAGVDRDRIETQLRVTRSPLRAITTAAEDSEFVIIGERKPSLADHIFGDVADRLAASTAGPVLVVRKLRSADS
ncbi:universal stress protein [Halohasta litorea]|uniref:Universal stress protein n=1 Tax=Halohasta litorea TaxID=869891 RepID=A0ABD6D9G3_9EURY|nr:universal stress protein [Halohasta litorea]